MKVKKEDCSAPDARAIETARLRSALPGAYRLAYG